MHEKSFSNHSDSHREHFSTFSNLTFHTYCTLFKCVYKSGFYFDWCVGSVGAAACRWCGPV